MTTSPNLLSDVENYYAGKLAEHGQSPRGVDWNGEESQFLRFEQLARIFSTAEQNFSVNDLGCGYGSLVDFLQKKYLSFTYTGYDLSPDMLTAARQRYAAVSSAHFVQSSLPTDKADFGIASGIFNVRLQTPDEEWLRYIEKTLDGLFETSRFGFSFNCLTSYVDVGKKRDYLYYADPCYLFDWCKRRYSRRVALLHDYALFDFTILVHQSGETP